MSASPTTSIATPRDLRTVVARGLAVTACLSARHRRVDSAVRIAVAPAVHATTITNPRRGLPIQDSYATYAARTSAMQATATINPSVVFNLTHMVQTQNLTRQSRNPS